MGHRGLQVLKKKLIVALCICHKVITCVTLSNGCIPEARTLHNYSHKNLKSYYYSISSEDCTGCLIEFEEMIAWNIIFHQQGFNMEMHWWYAKKSCNPFGSWNIFLGLACITGRCLPEWSRTNYSIYWYWSDIYPANGIVICYCHRSGKARNIVAT